jgi:hypothetical protein
MASDPLVAMRPQGDAVMVWHEHVRSGESVIDGGLWTAELAPDGTSQARVAVGLAPDTSAWDIAVEASGVANVTLQAPATYVQPDGGTSSSFVVQVARWTAGDGLHSPVTLSSPGPTVFNPTIAITGRGDAAAVWGQTRTVCSRCDGDSRVLAAVRPVGSSWEAPVELAPSHGYVPGVVAGGDGPAIAFWRQGPILDTAAWVSPRAPVALQRFTAPAITGLRASPSRLRPARAGPPTRAAATTTGTLVTYRLSAAARVRVRVERARGGRRVGRSCVAATRGNRHAALCERFVTMPGAFTRARPAGRDRFRFTGRLTARAIKPGRYRLAATATAGGRRGTAKHALLRIVG